MIPGSLGYVFKTAQLHYAGDSIAYFILQMKLYDFVSFSFARISYNYADMNISLYALFGGCYHVTTRLL
ncbi:hypothetical protein ACTJJ0_20275 [Chitinophaga sp. 22321]|uniref:Uncharacterized protein n=1 Tax=Chitinophaga hostae TaxID=2831022 RepID=A0ABS5J3U4_9BACT|nr:hypothetical protein [Chitinophaga hostae]MBS0029820.1 hypothetical protein [Chitinophaga hostae]